MKKMILLLTFPLWVMPAFAQQKKKPAPKKKQHAAATTAKKKNVVRETLPPGPSAGYTADPGLPAPERAPAPGASEKIFTSVEEMPEFPGGINALMHYLGNNIRYPAEAREDNVQGRVIVQFVIDKEGSIEQSVIMRDIGAGCGREALRVVNAMPKWRPGRMNGQAVRVYYTLPINFKLQDPDPVPADTLKQ